MTATGVPHDFVVDAAVLGALLIGGALLSGLAHRSFVQAVGHHRRLGDLVADDGAKLGVAQRGWGRLGTALAGDHAGIVAALMGVEMLGLSDSNDLKSRHK